MLKKTNYWIFCLTGITIAFNVAAISAIVPAVAKSMNSLEFSAGRIIWAYMIPYGVCALFYGPLSRKINIKHILVLALSLFSVFSFFSSIAQRLSSLFIFRLLAGIFAAGVIPLALIYIAHTFELKNRGKAVGTFFSITFISSLCGLFLTGIIKWRFIFLIPALSAAAAVILVLLLFEKVNIETDGRKSRYIQAFKNQRILRVFVYIFLISLLYHLARQWMGVYFHIQHQFSKFTISMLLTLVSFAGIFGEFFGGLSADKKGRLVTLSAGALIMGIALISLSVANKILFLGLIMFIWGLGWTINHSGLSTYLTDLPKLYTQEIASLNSSVRFLAGGTGAALGGFAMQKSFTITFITVGASLLILSLSSKKLLKIEREI